MNGTARNAPTGTTVGHARARAHRRSWWRRIVAWTGLIAIAATTCPAGSITGTVRALPPRDDGGQPAAAGAYESRRYKFVEKIDYDKLRDFVVYIDQPMNEVLPAEAAKQTVKTTQKDANFEPHVLPVVVGASVRWPNEDDIFHNVF